MLDDLTQEQWAGWVNYFEQDPWDEKRKDDRSAVNSIWSLKPHLEEGTEMPGFDGPGYSSEKEDDTAASWKRIKETAAKVTNGQLNRKTRNPTDG
jgi:hypothetical protein